MVCGREGPGVEFKVRLMSRLSREFTSKSEATIIITHSIRKHT